MYTYAIIDDEENCRIALAELVKQHHPEWQLLFEARNGQIAFDMIQSLKSPPNLVFLDIQMPVCDGFSFLQKFEQPIPFPIIFTTAFDKYAIKAIKFSALDYLLKPIDGNELAEALNRFSKINTTVNQKQLAHIKSQLSTTNTFHKLAIPSLSEIIFIDTPNIVYLKSDNNYTTILTQDGKQIISSKNIGFYESILEPQEFFRVHNSYLVNLKKIKKYVRGKVSFIEMENGESIGVSSRRKEELLQLLYIV